MIIMIIIMIIIIIIVIITGQHQEWMEFKTSGGKGLDQHKKQRKRLNKSEMITDCPNMVATRNNSTDTKVKRSE